MSNRHAPGASRILHVIDTIDGPPRKSWRVALIEESGRRLVEIRLCDRHPNGSVTPTGHRSVLRMEALGRIGAALLEVAQATGGANG